MPVVDWPLGAVVAVDVAAWAAVGFAAGYTAHRLPLQRLERDGRLTRLRAFERDGRWYERRLGIKSWKGRLPEAGDFFAGGFSKRRLAGARPDDLRRFVAETRRAELTHWWVLAAGPVFFLWNPWWLAVVMVGYAAAANVPCLVVQRYNRARLLRLLAVAERRAA
jgi:glycosyl-4,4'-diaponeurosporenoate acyltransferase